MLQQVLVQVISSDKLQEPSKQVVKKKNDLLFVKENERDTRSYTTTKALINYPINSVTKRAVVFEYDIVWNTKLLVDLKYWVIRKISYMFKE